MPLRALIFDSSYDQYRGVVSSIRIVDGALHAGARLRFMQANAVHDIEEVGVRTPVAVPVEILGPGEVGYLIAGIKDVGEARSGETVTTAQHGATEVLAGYRDPKPMVFCGLYPVDGDELPDLRDALDKLKLNDASFTFEPESSHALGIGFRCGFLGLLHMEIVRERLEREFNLSLIATAPSVEYRAFLTDGTELDIDNPTELPDASRIDHIDEPMLSATIITPTEYTGTVMELCQNKRGEMTRMEYLSPERVELVYTLPLAEVVIDFFDQLKSRTKGYASLDYEPGTTPPGTWCGSTSSSTTHRWTPSRPSWTGPRPTPTVARWPRSCASSSRARCSTSPFRPAIGGRIVARETVKAKRKDVLAKCYGGDITRKRKLLEKQKEGKKKMKNIGRVEVPQEAFISALRLGDD